LTTVGGLLVEHRCHRGTGRSCGRRAIERGEGEVVLERVDDRVVQGEHANADPGVAYLSGLGRDCSRIRVPYLGEYGEYVDRVQRFGRRAES
jgi:hypothetical protein